MIPRQLAAGLFISERAMAAINWDSVDPDIKIKWDKAREIIKVDDKGSFGANFFHHSEAIQKIFPEIQTARDAYEIQFQNLLRLARFAFQKSEESVHPKRIRILAFGHENYMAYALDRYFQDHNLGNCETVHVTLNDQNRMKMEKKGVSTVI